jgi:Gpi18-like mannosyltransferase
MLLQRFPGLKLFQNWRGVLIFLVLFQLFLNVPAFIGANQLPLKHGVPKSLLNPTQWPNIWARWDSEWYLKISAQGLPQKGQELAFFPMYPILIRLFSLGVTGLNTWVGYLISVFAFILAALLLWNQIKQEFTPGAAWSAIITLSIFPTSLFFSAIYTESLFLLFSVLVYWFSVREKYALAAVFVGLAALTRVTGVLLILIPFIEIFAHNTSGKWIKLLYCSGISSVGLLLYGTYLRIIRGSPFAFLRIQNTFGRKEPFTWPWKSFLDSFRVAFFGYGGLQDDWLMRSTSALEVFAVILFGACILGAFFLLRKSLFAYSFITLLLLLAAHGPSVQGLWSMSRYVLILFPCFIVLGIILNRLPRLKWVWLPFFALLIYLTICFGNGRWVD